MLPAVATLPSSLWYLISLTAQHSVHISLPFLLFVQWVVNGSGPISKEPSFPNNKTNVRWSKAMNVLLEYSLFSFNIVWEETVLICSPDDCVIHCWNRSNQFLCIELDDYNFQIDMINFSLPLASLLHNAEMERLLTLGFISPSSLFIQFAQKTGSKHCELKVPSLGLMRIIPFSNVDWN